MIKDKKIFVILFLFFYACDNSNKSVKIMTIEKLDTIKEKKEINSFPNEKKNNESSTCDEIIKELIKSSSGYDSISIAVKSFLRKDKIDITIDEVTKSYIRILISFKNEENRDATLAWFMLDLINNELMDITIDPENPINLTFDKKYIIKIKKLCTQDSD